jgi:hypothetical protein
VTEGEETAGPPTPGAAAAERVNETYANAPEEERARVAAETLQREAEALQGDPESLAALYAASEETIQAITTDLGRRVAQNDDGQPEETLLPARGHAGSSLNRHAARRRNLFPPDSPFPYEARPQVAGNARRVPTQGE